MRQFLIFLSFLFLLSTSVALGFEWNPAEFISVDEIDSELKAGKEVKGVVKTVFEGTKIEEFQFKVLSVERNAFPQGDLIWALAIGDKLEKTGVVVGMSGSPAYINGRLAGALAYGYFFLPRIRSLASPL